MREAGGAVLQAGKQDNKGNAVQDWKVRIVSDLARCRVVCVLIYFADMHLLICMMAGKQGLHDLVGGSGTREG